ncbi:MAG: hypothetical protein C0485_16555 [Pirellula sp.]|nr:hypothetical protein [Pirellula sp.]
MMDNDEFAALKDDIRKHGLRDPIATYKGQILDGRNRLKVCKQLKLEPMIVELNEEDVAGDPIAFVVSANLRRRHLTEAQRAMIAADLEKGFAVEAKKRQKLSEGRGKKGIAPVHRPKSDQGKSAKKAAKVMGVGARSVASAKVVVSKGAEQVADAVRAGTVSVKVAERLVRAVPDRDQQVAIVEKAVKSASADKAINAAVTPKVAPPQYPISDFAIETTANFVGLLNRIESEYGGLAGMFADPHWDKALTAQFIQQIHSLSLQLWQFKEDSVNSSEH